MARRALVGLAAPLLPWLAGYALIGVGPLDQRASAWVAVMLSPLLIGGAAVGVLYPSGARARTVLRASFTSTLMAMPLSILAVYPVAAGLIALDGLTKTPPLRPVMRLVRRARLDPVGWLDPNGEQDYMDVMQYVFWFLVVYGAVCVGSAVSAVLVVRRARKHGPNPASTTS